MTTANRTRLRVWGTLFITLALLGGCADSSLMTSLMTQVPRMDTTDSEHALVTFLRPAVSSEFDLIVGGVGDAEGNTDLDVWDRAKLVGILVARCYIQYEAEPGEHLFLISDAEQGHPHLLPDFPWEGPPWRYVKANLQKGKHYYILANYSADRTTVRPIGKGDRRARDRIDVWLSKLRPTALIGEQAEEYASSKLPYVREAIAEFECGGVRCQVLNSDDWR